MSEEILTYHWGKHHRGYVENLNKQVAETELDAMPLEDIIALAYNKGDILPPFNNAAQVIVFFFRTGKGGNIVDKWYLIAKMHTIKMSHASHKGYIISERTYTYYLYLQ